MFKIKISYTEETEAVLFLEAIREAITKAGVKIQVKQGKNDYYNHLYITERDHKRAEKRNI